MCFLTKNSCLKRYTAYYLKLLKYFFIPKRLLAGLSIKIYQIDFINIGGDIFPRLDSTHPQSLMSSKAVLAHELGHRNYELAVRSGKITKRLDANSWNDEFRASYWAAKNVTNLTQLDRAHLINDAISRTDEANIIIEYNDFMKGILYGY